MKLVSLRIEELNQSGWSLPDLQFGEHITQLFGPNGSGKTPVIQSIAFALGYPIKFRDDIYKHCEAVVLTVAISSSIVVLKRLINESFDVEVSESSERQSFYRESDYSRYLFEKLNIPMPELTSTGNLPVQAYMATLLPLFYVDQDHGYTSLYKAPNPFIKDQYAEMMRLIYQMAPRHSFDAKKLAFAKKNRLDEVDRLIVRKTEQIERLLADLNGVRRQRDEIVAEITQYKSKLQQLRTSSNTKSDSRSTLDALIEDQHDRLTSTRREASELQARVNGFVRIKSEIEVEINTLSLNEEARRVFASFNEICANPSCGLFLGSSESYGKSLLYLRDQVKDLQATSAAHQSRIASLAKDIDEARNQIVQLRDNRERLESEEEVDGLVESIGALTRKIIGLEIESQNIKQLDEEETAYVAFLNERSSLQNELASLLPTGGSADLRAIEIRAELKAGVRFWLEKLNTKNVSKDIVVDADFGFVFGDEKVSQFKGSTLLRVVLAFHTAAFELYTRNPANEMRFLVLDTPRQQDIDVGALGSYVTELKRLARAQHCQIVFSTTEYRYNCVQGDQEWTPAFPGAEQSMFLNARNPPNTSAI